MRFSLVIDLNAGSEPGSIDLYRALRLVAADLERVSPIDSNVRCFGVIPNEEDGATIEYSVQVSEAFDRVSDFEEPIDPESELLIHYAHFDCPDDPGFTWEDRWTSAVDSDCPNCAARDVEPVFWHDADAECTFACDPNRAT